VLALPAALIMFFAGYHRLHLAIAEIATTTAGFWAPYVRPAAADKAPLEECCPSGRFAAHGVLFAHFGRLLLDIPCAALAGVVLVTGWRANGLVRDLRAAPDAAARRTVACVHFLQLLVDVPIVLVALVVSVPLYRLGNLVAIVRTDLDTPNGRRVPVLNQLLQLLIDIPFVALGLCGLWRLPWLLVDIGRSSGAPRRRRAALEAFLLMLLDVPALAAFLVVATLGVYRFRGERGLWKDLTAPDMRAPWSAMDLVYDGCLDGRRFEAHLALLRELIEVPTHFSRRGIGLTFCMCG
jgi:hypothetical protein